MVVIVECALEFRRATKVADDTLEAAIGGYRVLPFLPLVPFFSSLVADAVNASRQTLVFVQFVHHSGGRIHDPEPLKTPIATHWMSRFAGFTTDTVMAVLETLTIFF